MARSNTRTTTSVKEYTVVQRRSTNSLIEAVTDLMADGWKVTGGVSAVEDATSMTFVQAMVK